MLYDALNANTEDNFNGRLFNTSVTIKETGLHNVVSGYMKLNSIGKNEVEKFVDNMLYIPKYLSDISWPQYSEYIIMGKTKMTNAEDSWVYFGLPVEIISNQSDSKTSANDTDPAPDPADTDQ